MQDVQDSSASSALSDDSLEQEYGVSPSPNNCHQPVTHNSLSEVSSHSSSSPLSVQRASSSHQDASHISERFSYMPDADQGSSGSLHSSGILGYSPCSNRSPMFNAESLVSSPGLLSDSSQWHFEPEDSETVQSFRSLVGNEPNSSSTAIDDEESRKLHDSLVRMSSLDSLSDDETVSSISKGAAVDESKELHDIEGRLHKAPQGQLTDKSAKPQSATSRRQHGESVNSDAIKILLDSIASSLDSPQSGAKLQGSSTSTQSPPGASHYDSCSNDTSGLCCSNSLLLDGSVTPETTASSQTCSPTLYKRPPPVLCSSKLIMSSNSHLQYEFEVVTSPDEEKSRSLVAVEETGNTDAHEFRLMLVRSLSNEDTKEPLLLRPHLGGSSRPRASVERLPDFLNIVASPTEE